MNKLPHVPNVIRASSEALLTTQWHPTCVHQVTEELPASRCNEAFLLVCLCHPDNIILWLSSYQTMHNRASTKHECQQHVCINCFILPQLMQPNRSVPVFNQLCSQKRCDELVLFK